MSTGPPRTYRERLLAGISRFSSADREELLAFRRGLYSPSSIFCDPAYFSWTTSRAALWVYRKDGKIEAQQALWPFTLKIGATTRPAGWACGLFVNPAFQMRGIGSVLQDVAFAENGLNLGLEISNEARKTYLKAGWADLGTLPLYVRPLDARVLYEKRTGFSFTPAGRRLAGLGNFALDVMDGAMRRILGLSRLRAEPQPRFDERVDGLWRSVSPSYPVIATRDLVTLRWRFDEFPNCLRYQIFYFLRGAELRGYLVLRHGEWDGVKAGFIVDFLCAPEDTLAVLAHAISWFRRSDAVAIYCLHRTPISLFALKMLGFIERDSTWRLMVRFKDADPVGQLLLSDPSNWFITLGDSDVDRPREGTTYPPPYQRHSDQR